MRFMMRFIIGLVFSLALALLIIFLAWFVLTRFSGFSEDDVRACARKFIESHPDWIPKGHEAVVQDVKIEKMNLHDQELSTAKINLRLRGDLDTWETLYLVCSPDYSTYVISENKYLLNDVDRDGYAQVFQRTDSDKQRQASTPAPTPTSTDEFPAPTATPTSTVIYREFPAPTPTPTSTIIYREYPAPNKTP